MRCPSGRGPVRGHRTVIVGPLETRRPGTRPKAGGGLGPPAARLLVGVVVLAAISGAGLWWSGGTRLPTPDGPSTFWLGPPSASDTAYGSEVRLALLPLRDLSPDTADGYFARAMTTEITAALGRVPGLEVVSHESAARFAGSRAPLRSVADSLGVRYVLEGSARRSENGAVISVRLVDGPKDTILWARRFQRPAAGESGLEGDVAGAVAASLRSTFAREDEARVRAGLTRDPAAYELYLRAVDLLGRSPDSASSREALGLLRRAVAHDSTFAAAWFDLSTLYRDQGGARGEPQIDSGRVALERAIHHAGVRSVRALYRAAEARGNGDSARARVRRAVAQNPDDVGLIQTLAYQYQYAGDLPRAYRWGRRARDLDPLGAPRWQYLGELYTQLGMDDRAEPALRKALAFDPTDRTAWHDLRQLRRCEGRYRSLMALEDTIVATAGDPLETEFRGTVYLWLGHPKRARGVLERARQTRPWEEVVWFVPELLRARRLTGDTTLDSALLRRAEATLRQEPFTSGLPYQLVSLVAASGDGTQAATLLRKYMRLGGHGIRFIVDDPDFDVARSDTAFQSALSEARTRMESQAQQVRRMLAQDGS